ncbi:MAG: GNAT family N-acetyltransferase [Phycisphaerae bacterium]|jgi:ribosomal protein S18 acetylase RimI-like enzyme|nr:GNAT family N-acetyltransferase [Phycisphaerae bacterium]MCZ2401073.1 GNAT family N-acetyltransferase [Phycisphaerae bacterium]NUQ48896.1 GNAT family N-acetyltransferase [Phycisphaerae bacterium]
MALLLAPGDGEQEAAPQQVAGFLASAAAGGGELRAYRLPAAGDALRALLATLVLPGRVALVFVPGRMPGCDAEAMRRLSAAVFGLPEMAGLHYVQALVEEQNGARIEWLRALGFTRLTELLYLEREVTYPWVPEPEAVLDWLPYSAADHPRFASLMARTYEESRDCPELTGIRPMDDVIASHTAAGPFEPGLWQMALRDGTPVGCILLGRIGPASLEIVYMGVAAPERGSGLGQALLRRGFDLARRARAEWLTLAVDVRNDRARRLYERFGFRHVAARSAYLKRPPLVDRE